MPGLALSHVEDRGERRRRTIVRWFFIFGLVSWGSLAIWWATYFYLSDKQLREAVLRAYAAEEVLVAQAACDLAPALGTRIDGTPFTVEKLPLGMDALTFPWVDAGCGVAVTVHPEERARLRHEAKRKIIMLAGEGTLLIGLLFACLVGLYRYLDQAWKLNRRTESFVHSVTHELKSPLAGIRALLQTFSTIELKPEERRSYAELGLAEVARLDHLVGDVLLSSRLESDAYVPRIEELDLEALLGAVRDRKQVIAAERGGTISLTVEKKLARCDREALSIIVENLVENALKYSPETPRVEIVVREKAGKTAVSVTDHGIGLEKEERARVFEKFYRSPAGELVQAKGTGLGLYLAQALARACGGRITVESGGKGKGSTFEVVV